MRIITSDTGFLVYRKLFQQLLSSQSPVVIWQNVDATGQKVRCYSSLNAFHFESKKLYFSPLEGEISLFSPGHIFFYSEESQIIFKSNLTEVAQAICLDMPTELKLLEDPEVTHIRGVIGVDLQDVWKVKRLKIDENQISDVMKVKSLNQRSGSDQQILNDELFVSVDEEDELFADQRESPRARPKQQKYVTLQTDTGESGRFPLFDLSQGGMAFVVLDENQFTKGAMIYVFGIDAKVLDDPLIGKVMSVRSLDESKIEFKVGVKFEEGQE
ncbi:MAG: PilZ domain-containing protein [Bacteriovoracaceae bacterium]